MGVLLERATCPVCDEADARVVWQVPYSDPDLVAYLRSFYEGRAEVDLLADDVYELRRCDRCTLLFQAHVPGPDLLARIYEGWIDAAASAEAASRRPTSVAAGYRRILDALAAAVDRPLAGLRVLDLGMGWGGFLDVAREAGCEVLGVEVSAERRVEAEGRGIEVVDLAEVAPGSVDACVSLQVCEHLVDPAADLTRAAAAVRPGGAVYVQVPNGSRRALGPPLRRRSWVAPKGSRLSLNAVAPLEHLNCYPPRALRALVRVARLAPQADATEAGTSPVTRLRAVLRPPLAHGAMGRRPADGAT